MDSPRDISSVLLSLPRTRTDHQNRQSRVFRKRSFRRPKRGECEGSQIKNQFQQADHEIRPERVQARRRREAFLQDLPGGGGGEG